jgi:hypothetical protein
MLMALCLLRVEQQQSAWDNDNNNQAGPEAYVSPYDSSFQNNKPQAQPLPTTVTF